MSVVEEDEVMQEIRTTRAAFAEEHGHDLKRMIAAWREIAIKSGFPISTRQPCKIVYREEPATVTE
jgi:hypothetical protein